MQFRGNVLKNQRALSCWHLEPAGNSDPLTKLLNRAQLPAVARCPVQEAPHKGAPGDVDQVFAGLITGAAVARVNGALEGFEDAGKGSH